MGKTRFNAKGRQKKNILIDNTETKKVSGEECMWFFS